MVEAAQDAYLDLRILQESVVINANPHALWNFTPEFLFDYEIVLPSWECTNVEFNPDGDEVVIEYGPVNWRMTETQLWISNYVDSPAANRYLRPYNDYVVPNTAKRFLEQVPFLPFRNVWFHWRVSALVTDQLVRMLENPLPSKWPNEFEVRSNRTNRTVVFDSEGHNFQIMLGRDQVVGDDETLENPITLECYAIPSLEQGRSSAIAEMDSWVFRWHTLRRAVLGFAGGESDA